MRRTARDFDSFVAKNVTTEWEAQKQRIFEHFGLGGKSASAMQGGDNGGFGLSTFGASSFGRSRWSGSVGPAGNGGNLGTNSVWAKSNLEQSVLGKSVSARPAEQPSSVYQGTLFADVDPSTQAELTKPVQLRQQRYSQAVKKLNLTRLSTTPASGNFAIMKEFGDLTRASGDDMVSHAIPLFS